MCLADLGRSAGLGGRRKSYAWFGWGGHTLVYPSTWLASLHILYLALPAVECAIPGRGGKAGALSPSPSLRPELGSLMAGVKGSLRRNRGTSRTREPGSQKLRSCPKIQGQTFHLFLDKVTGCGNNNKKVVSSHMCTMVMTYAKHPLFLFLTRSQKLRQRTGCWLILLRRLSLNCINAIYAREHSRRGKNC